MIIAICNQVLPAYAGMIPGRIHLPGDHARAPRVCGDDPSPAPYWTSTLTCSPRMRG